MFTSWKVICPTKENKYRYLCRCVECNSEKEFSKYKLLSGNYSYCKQCAHNFIKDIPEIRKHWNTELNKTVFTKPQDFNLNKEYWFMCDKGHNFKSSIKNYSNSKCISCQERSFDSSIKELTFEYLKLLLTALWSDIDISKDYVIIVPMLKKVFRLVEHDRYAAHFKYFKREQDMIDELEDLSKFNLEYKNKGFDVISIQIENNILKNVDTIEKTMLECHCNISKY